MKTRLLAVLLPAMFSCTSEPSVSDLKGPGTVVDNGGDEIHCRAGSSAFSGRYTLDYVLTYDSQLRDPDEATWEELRERLVTLFDTKLPELSGSLHQYLDTLESSDESRPRVWHASSMGLTDLQDEDILQHIPDDCMTERDGELVPDLRQMVRRRYLVGTDVPKVHYYFDQTRLRTLREDRPLQYSYLVVHEWLWDYADSGWANRAINRYLHTKGTELADSVTIRRVLRSYGMNGDEAGHIGVPNAEVERMRRLFEDVPQCDFRKRIVKQFYPESDRELVDAGETKTFVADVEVSDLVGSQTCGMALLYGHRTPDSGARFSVTLSRHVARVTTAHSGGSLKSQLLTGICSAGDNPNCRYREGELENLLFVNRYAGPWTLEITNDPSSAGRAEVVAPYLVIVGMRDE